MELSRKRAEAVVKILISEYKIETARLTPKGVGFLSPKDSNKTEKGRKRNRRVELVEM